MDGANNTIINTYSYAQLQGHTDPFIQRSYETEDWYYLTFKPLNEPYAKHKKWYNEKGLDSVRRFLYDDCNEYLITRECEGGSVAKTHINVLCISPRDLEKKYHNNTYKGKYKIYSKRLPKCQGDRTQVRDYIIKDSKLQPFQHYKDFLYKLCTKGSL